MTDVPHDLFGFEAPTEEELSNISTWAEKALELTAEIAEVEAYLAQLEKKLARIEEVELPEALMTANMLEFTMLNGGKISIKDVLQGGLSKEPDVREYTMQWVIDNDGEDIIKDHFEIDYVKGDYDSAIALRKILNENKIHFDEFESIHGMTLQAFLREKLREEVMPPFDKMGIRYFKRADIKMPKDAK